MDYNGDTADLSTPYDRVVDGSPWTRSSISQTISYNSLDDSTLPHEGILASATQEYAGLGGTSDFYKLTGKAKWYYTVNDDADIIASLAGSAGHVFNTGGEMEVFDQFQLGQQRHSRFRAQRHWSAQRNTAMPIGGTTYFTASAEATFPLPFVSRDAGFRGAIFADAGTLYGNEVDVTARRRQSKVPGSSLRASVGLGLLWASPFGPLRVDYAFPIAKEDFDKVQNLKFGISSVLLILAVQNCLPKLFWSVGHGTQLVLPAA